MDHILGPRVFVVGVVAVTAAAVDVVVVLLLFGVEVAWGSTGAKNITVQRITS